MPYLSRYHLGEQQAGALLGPVADVLQQLERRVKHYVERLEMSPEDQDAVVEAQRVLATARAEIDRIRASAAELASDE